MLTIDSIPRLTPVKALVLANGEYEWRLGLVSSEFDRDGEIWYTVLCEDGVNKTRLFLARDSDVCPI